MKQQTGLGRFVSFDNYLPEEIIKEILLRLDVMSLRRIECVCKSWQTLLRQPSFINNHLKRQPPSVLLIGDLSAKPSYDSLINDFDFLASCRSNSLDHGVQRYDFPPWLIVESNDNGVLLLSDVRKTFYDCLWNPATGEFKTLPSPSTCLRHCTIIIDLLGLGYDSLTDDFKVVRVCAKDFKSFKTDKKVFVYSLRRNSWKSMEMPYILSSSSSSSFSKNLSSDLWTLSGQYSSVVVNRSIHWMMAFKKEDNPNNELVIVAFDMSREVFKRIDLPPDLVEIDDFMLEKFSECLSLAVTNETEVSILDIWVMKEYGVLNSWIKQVKVDLRNFPPDLPSRFDCIREDSTPLDLGYGGNMLILTGESFIIWYELERNKVNYVCPADKSMPNVWVYTKSIIRFT